MFLNINKITFPNASFFSGGLYDFCSSDVLCPVNICVSSGKEISTFLITSLRHSDCLYLAKQEFLRRLYSKPIVYCANT